MSAAGGPTGVTERIIDLGEQWRLDAFGFTGWFDGDFPIVWWLTMLVIAVIGGFGMGTSIDWYVEAQRIQSAKTCTRRHLRTVGRRGGNSDSQRLLGRGDSRVFRHGAQHRRRRRL